MSGEIIGSYEVQLEKGRGDLGVVYQARQQHKRSVALKVLQPKGDFEIYPDTLAEAFSRFQEVSHQLAALKQAGILAPEAFGQHEGHPYWVMPWMPGGSLADRLTQGKLDPPEVLRMLKRLAPALDAVHALGVLHGDIKPANILFDADGEVWLSDFGVAQLASELVPQDTTALIGPPGYLSPEKAQGMTLTDGRSDLYMLGVVLFEALTGRLPFEGASPLSLAVRQITDQVPDAVALRPDLPVSWGASLQIMLSKDPQMRFGTLAEIVQVLEAGWTTSAETVTVPALQLRFEEPPESAVATEVALPKVAAPAAVAQPAQAKRRSRGWAWVVTGLFLLSLLAFYGWDRYRQAEIDLPALARWAQNIRQPSTASVAEVIPPISSFTPPFFPTPSMERPPSPTVEPPTFTPTLEVGALITATPIPTPLPTPTLFPTLIPTPSEPLSYSAPLSYTIEYNDTLFTIASQFHVDVGELISINNLYCDSRLPPSVRMVIPPFYQFPLPSFAPLTKDTLAAMSLLHVGVCVDKVRALAFSPDDRILATATSTAAGNFVYLWQVGDWKPLARLKGHTAKINSLAFSDDGEMIVTGSDDATVRLWQTKDGALLATFKGHFNSVTDVAFFPGSQTLVSTSRDQTVRIWSVDGTELNALRGYPAFSVAVAPDGQMMAVGYADAVRLWQVRDFSLVRYMPSNDVVIRHLAFSPDGQMLASNMYAWQVVDGRQIYAFGSDGDTVSFSKDGQILAVGRRMFAVSNGNSLKTLQSPVPESPRVKDTWDATAFSSHGSLFAWGSLDGLFVFSIPRGVSPTVSNAQQEYVMQAGDNFLNIADRFQLKLGTLMDANGLKCANLPFLGQNLVIPVPDNLPLSRQLTPLSLQNVSRLAKVAELDLQCVLTPGEIFFGYDSQTLIAGSALWRISTASPLIQAEDVPRHFDGSPATDLPSPVLVPSPDQQTVALRLGKQIQIWSLADGRLLRTLTGHTDWVTSLAFSPDGQMLVSGSGSNEQITRLWNPVDGTQIGTLNGFTVQRMRFVPPDGQLLLTEGDSAVRIWRMSDRYLLHSIQGVEGRAAISPDGVWMALPTCQKYVDTTCKVELVSIYRTSGELSVSFQPFTDHIQEIQFSPDGKTLAVASGYGVLLHPVGNWHEFVKLTVPQNLSAITQIAFSPDSSVLLTLGEDHTVRLWNTSDGSQLFVMEGVDWDDFAFSPDGTMLAVWAGRSLSLWGVQP